MKFIWRDAKSFPRRVCREWDDGSFGSFCVVFDNRSRRWRSRSLFWLRLMTQRLIGKLLDCQNLSENRWRAKLNELRDLQRCQGGEKLTNSANHDTSKSVEAINHRRFSESTLSDGLRLGSIIDSLMQLIVTKTQSISDRQESFTLSRG
jgi:hypothetical protein